MSASKGGRQQAQVAGHNAAIAPGVHHVSGCRLAVGGGPWAYAEAHAGEISEFWQAQKQANPKFFDGVVHLLRSCSIDGDGVFHGDFVRTRFRNYLYWRLNGFEASGVLDGFGTALVRTSDGKIVFGEQTAGNVNTGLLDLLGGFIDARDVRDDGVIDIDASISREVSEETGFNLNELKRRPGYYIAVAMPQISIAILYDAGDNADQLEKRVAAFLSKDDCPELQRIRTIRRLDEAGNSTVPRYARLLLDRVLEHSL